GRTKDARGETCRQRLEAKQA
ncbi:unnamed protein product, partial [Adineta steineri]